MFCRNCSTCLVDLLYLKRFGKSFGTYFRLSILMKKIAFPRKQRDAFK